MTVIFAILTAATVALGLLALIIRERAQALAALYRDEAQISTYVCNTGSVKRLAEHKVMAPIRSPRRARRRIRTYSSSHFPKWAPHH
jgi:hypothetical protein